MDLITLILHGIISVFCITGYVADHVDNGHDVKLTDLFAMVFIGSLPILNVGMLLWISKGSNIVIFRGRK